MPGRRTRGRRRGPRRQAEWFDTFINETTASGQQDVQDLSSPIAQDEKKGMTIVRIIIDLTTLLVTAGTGGLLSYGIALVSNEAAAAIAYPDADDEDDMGRGWLWRARRVVSASNLNDVSMNSRLVYDIRAKRRFSSEDDGLYFIMDAGTLSSDVNTDGLIRVLALKS